MNGFTSGDWDLSVSDKTIELGSSFFISYKAPVGETANLSIALGYEVLPSVYLGTFAGTGAWVEDIVSYTPFQDCHVFLINETSGEIMKTMSISVYGDLINVISTDRQTYNIGDTAYFSGSYINTNTYTFLRVVKPDGEYLGSAQYNGVIDHDQYLDLAGTWTYVLLNDGEEQEWSYGTFIVEDAGTSETWYGLPYWLPYLLGVFLTLFVTFSPLIMASYIVRKTRVDKINIPALVYTGFFFFGMVISVMIGWLPSWLPFVILFSMIVYFAIQWLYGQKGEVQGD
jgi:hypothetical protein